MAKQKKNRRAIDPEDVLEGRARPNARELLALIHDVNPTGNDLPAREAARRYAQKSRLQSLLVRRFPDEIEVEPPEDEPGVVGLRHVSGADACHAVLASLDDDARSWVQRRLDLGHESVPPPSLTPIEDPPESAPPSDAPLDDLSTPELLARGQAALKAYDYEAARERFLAALDRGNREAVPLLLTVLVEHLALDADALALEARIDAETLRDRDVRLLLALAAARTDQRDRAIRLARADEGDAAAEVFVALARGALARGEADHAAHDVAEIQRRGPAHAALLDLAATIKRRRAEERAPLEAEAQRLLDEGRVEEAAAKAAAITARWPESTVAHAVTRAGEERRRRAEARALAAEGKAALDQGESARALMLLRKAAAMGLAGEDAAQVERDLARAEALARSRQEWERAADIVRVLNEGHVLRGLTEYADLDPPRREHVKARTPFPELFYIDEMGVQGSGPETRIAAQAAMALKRAMTLINTDPSGALDLMIPHEDLLRRVDHGRQALGLARESAMLKEALEATRLLTEGMRAFSSGPGSPRERLMLSIKLLSQVRRDHLDPQGQTHLDLTLLSVRRMLERLDRALHVGKLRTEGNLMGARDALDALISFEEDSPEEELLAEEREQRAAAAAANASGDAPAEGAEAEPETGAAEPKKRHADGWREKRDEVVRHLFRSAGVRAAGVPRADALLGQEAPQLLDVPVTLLPGGREVVLGEAHDNLIFLQILDVETGAVTRRASFCFRHPVEFTRIQQHAGRAALIGGWGCLEIDPRTWEPYRIHGVEFDDGKPDDAILATGGRFFWFSRVGDRTWGAFGTSDMERDVYGRVHSAGTVHVFLHPLLGSPEPRVLVLRDNGGVTQYEPRGSPVAGTQRTLWALPFSVVTHPSGEGLAALLLDPEMDPDDDSEPEESSEPRRRKPRVSWAETDALGVARRAPGGEDRTLEDLDPDAPYQVASARDERMLFVLYTTLDGTRRLVGLAARTGTGAGAGLERRFAVEVPPRLTLAQDAEARAVVALSPHEEGMEAVRLGASPPVFAHDAPPAPPVGDARRWLCLTPVLPCSPWDVPLWRNTDEDTGHRLPMSYMAFVKAEDRSAMIDRVIGEREHIVPRYAAALQLTTPAFAEYLAAAVLARHAADPEMAQLPAMRAARAGDWQTVRDLLSPIDPAPLRNAAARHHDHLLGVALLQLGDMDEARRVLARGADRAGCCDLSVPLAVAGLPGGAAPSPAYRAAQAIEQAVRAADGCLATGDAAGARRALSRLVVREAREVQSLARLARAWLAAPDAEGLDKLARRIALAAFRSAHAETSATRRRELPLAGARWDRATLDALAEEAFKLLDDERKASLAADVGPDEAPTRFQGA